MVLFIIQRTTWIICNLFWQIFFKFEVKGTENIKSLKSGGVIFIGSHSSMFDPFMLGSSIPTPYFKYMKGLRLLTYYTFIVNRWYGPIIRAIGAYPVYPGKDKKLSNKLKRTVDYLNNDYSIVMFPQGKRSATCETETTRPGVAYLAKTTKAILVPVHIKNSYQIKLRDILFRRRRIELIFGQPFQYQDIIEESDDLFAAAQKIMQRVCSL